MNEGIEPGDVWSIGNVPDAPMPDAQELPPPSPPKRRMLQPIKDELRRQLEVARAEAALWAGRYDDVVAQLEGEAKCFGAGFLCAAGCAVAAWWVFA